MPALSMRAFISLDTSLKYVGEARMIPCACSIIAMQSFTMSFSTAQRWFFFFHTLVTCHTPADFLSGKLKQLCFYSLFFEFSENIIDQNVRIAILASASIKSHYLHRNPLFREFINSFDQPV